MRTVVYFALLLLCACALRAQRARRIGDDQPLRNEVSKLPVDERSAIHEAVRPAIAHWLSRIGGEDEESLKEDVLSVQGSLRYERRDGLILVQAYNLNGCGAVGNCEFFLLNNQHQLLLSNVVAYYMTVLGPSRSGFPDVLLGEHISASQTAQTWYRFNGSRYRAVQCAIDTYGFPYKDDKRHREFGACPK